MTLAFKYSGETSASFLAPPKGTEVRSQLLSLHRKYPRASGKDLFKLVVLDKWDLDQNTDPGLADLAKKFERIEMPPVLPDVLMVDATNYEIWSESLWGSRMYVSMIGPQPHPLIQWVEELRHLGELHRPRKP
jgi:hypothetical protein